MNSIRQAYEQGLKIRYKYCWGKDEWIKKHSDIESIDEKGKIHLNLSIDFDFDKKPQDWVIWDDKFDIKQAIQYHINSIQNLLNSL